MNAEQYRHHIHRVNVNYTVRLTHEEYLALAKLGREWGYEGKNLAVVKRALQNSGDSGCLSQLNDIIKRMRKDPKRHPDQDFVDDMTDLAKEFIKDRRT